MEDNALKIIVEKMYNEIGGEFLNEDEVPMTITTTDKIIYIYVDKIIYKIPKIAFNGIL